MGEVFQKRHPELAIMKLQAVEQKKPKYLCPNIVGTFYDNLENLYNTHKYQPDHMWNCDNKSTLDHKGQMPLNP